MKKLFALILCLCLLLSLAACGGKEEPTEAAPEAAPVPQVPGETFDVGDFTVLVPEGWGGVACADFFADDPEAIDPSHVQVCKGGSSTLDTLSKPVVEIQLDHSEHAAAPSPDWYDGAETLEPLTTGAYTWEGFQVVLYDVPQILLSCRMGDALCLVTVWPDQGEGGTISLADDDVIAILASISPKN